MLHFSFVALYTNYSGTRVKTVAALKGARPFADFKAAIDGLLAEQPKAVPEKPTAP